jgi:hypothetical protein
MTFYLYVDYDVPNWFLTSKNFYRSPFSKWPPQYHTNWTLFDFNKISYVGRLWCRESIRDIIIYLPPKLIPDIDKFLPVTIFKLDATIPHKFNIVRFQRNFIFSYFQNGHQFVTMQSVHLSLLSVADLGDFIIVRL